MEYRQLGRSGLRVSSLALGTMTFGGLEAVSRPPLIYPCWHQRKTASDRLSPADLSLLGPHLQA
jgi:aryl-alcohol dehydrogenase-like predicted oxidoreductase